MCGCAGCLLMCDVWRMLDVVRGVLCVRVVGVGLCCGWVLVECCLVPSWFPPGSLLVTRHACSPVTPGHQSRLVTRDAWQAVKPGHPSRLLLFCCSSAALLLLSCSPPTSHARKLMQFPLSFSSGIGIRFNISIYIRICISISILIHINIHVNVEY